MGTPICPYTIFTRGTIHDFLFAFLKGEPIENGTSAWLFKANDIVS